MLKKITAALACLCVALGIALGIEHHKRVQAQEQNARMEQQMREIRSQVDGIWSEYVSTIKRIQQHGGE